jgi:hypothetical protein
MPRIEPIPWDELDPRHRKFIEDGMAAGAYTDPLPLQIFAYVSHDTPRGNGERHPNYPNHLLPSRMLELLRIRSAQLGGCEPCMASRKDEGATEDAVACLVDPALRGDLSDRERIAIEFIDLLATDHHRIDDDTYRRLSEHFTTAEIVELGLVCASAIGTHRFLHTLNVHGDADPVIRYDPDQVDVSKAELDARVGEKAVP